MAQPNTNALVVSHLNVRRGPGEMFDIITTLPYGTRVFADGRSADGNWVHFGAAAEGVYGWANVYYLMLDEGITLGALPVMRANVAPDRIALRAGPDEAYPVETVLSQGVPLAVEGRDPTGAWLLAHTQDLTLRGWLAAGDITLDAGAGIERLWVVGAPPTLNLSEPSALAQTGDAALDAIVYRLHAVPIVPSAVSERARQVFLAGLQRGNQPDVFTLVGDCHSADTGFMNPFGSGRYDLGGYGYLQTTIDYFSATRPNPAAANSFVNDSFTAWHGATAISVLDPTWASPTHCVAGESPLLCEYRLSRPSIAIIMLGSMDVVNLNAELYEEGMREVVQASIDAGVLPVLTTYPSSPGRAQWEKTLRFNGIVLDIAEDESIPVINFWLASRALPNYGLEDDYWHLTSTGERVSFNGDERRFGGTLHNLLTLHTLEVIRCTR